ncbi:hypothetical protein [Mesorhizobium sp. KR9-304]|uniref:hypothetical protein n=1 Tax=Mesorhizobium sp. KR9-304 TaxID=3156614 RepID=UPI0032B425F9
MRDEHLPEFAGTYLEDSYFLGVVADGDNLQLKFLFALTIDHADYAPPRPGEAHCYREGNIVLERPSILEWRAGKPNITQDLDGTLDFGSIELYRSSPSRFRIVTEWFDATVETERVLLALSDADV